MLAHVYQLTGLAHGTESGLAHCLGGAHKGHNSAVGGIARIHIQQFHTIHTLHGIGYLPYHTHVATLTEIGNALHQSLYSTHYMSI